MTMRKATITALVLAAALSLSQLGTLGADESAAQWIELMRDGQASSRKQAREALIAIGAAAIPVLIDASYDEDDWIRWEAVNALGSIAFDQPLAVIEAIPALVDRALYDSNSHPRWRSLWALSSFSQEVVDGQVVPSLQAGFDSEDERVLWNAAVASAYFGRIEAVPFLNQSLDSEDAFQAWEAVYCLGMVHNEESVALLAAILTDFGSYEVRLVQEAALTLGRIGDPAAVPALLIALENPESGVRWRAAQALEELGDPGTISAIKAALAHEEDEFTAQKMREAIESLEDRPQMSG